MALNLNTIVPASLKAKEVATVDYVDNSYTQLQTTLQSLATSEEARDGIINTFYQTSAPTSGMNFGDYWLDTDASGYPVYRYEGTNHLNSGTLTWKVSTSNSATAIQKAYIAQTTANTGVTNAATAQNTANTAVTNAATAQTAANAAQTTANSKITTYYQTGIPTSTAIGDLWIDTDDNNKMYRAAMIGANETKAGEWVQVGIDVSSQLPTTVNSTVAPTSSNVYPVNTLWRQSVTINSTTQYNHWLSAGGGVWNSIGGTYIDGGSVITGYISADRIQMNTGWAGVIYNSGGTAANYKMKIDFTNGSIHIK